MPQTVTISTPSKAPTVPTPRTPPTPQKEPDQKPTSNPDKPVKQ